VTNSFVATVGHHAINFTVEYANRRFYGNVDLNVCEQRDQMVNIRGPVVHNQGDYMIGDHEIAMNISLANGQNAVMPEYVEVELRPNAGATQVRKRRFQPATYRTEESRYLSLVLQYGDWKRQVLVSGGTVHRLGRGRYSDLLLRVPPNEDPGERNSERISRSHATVEFCEDGFRWTDRSTHGTRVVGGQQAQQRLVNSQAGVWQNRVRLNVADVLPLACQSFSNQLHVSDLEIYRRFVTRELHAAYVQTVGPSQAVRIRREDSWADQEEYLLLQHSALIGSDVDCAIQAPGSSVHFAHAYLHFLGGSFWLEQVQPSCRITIYGSELSHHALIPLRPWMDIVLGELRIRTQTWPW
jgi:hypothetical protein